MAKPSHFRKTEMNEQRVNNSFSPRMLLFFFKIRDAYKDLPSHPVPVEQFEGYVEGETGELEEQYNETKNIGTNASVSYAQKYPNDNRYLNIIPYNHSRVPLYPQSSGPMPKNLPPPVYINASYIPGEKNIKQYIATQVRI